MSSRTRHGVFTKATSTVLVAFMTAWPAAGLARAATEPPLEPGMGVLDVASEPPGAAVYMNGAFVGTTPVNVEHVSPGDHRVQVVKDGYLENSRVVAVRAGSQSVQVKLTPDTSSVRKSLQVEAEPKKGGGGGGGGKKGLWIGLGVVAAGAGAYLAFHKSNKPPIPGMISASPGSGLAGATNFTFTSTGSSDPDGDPLTYTWNFGDGGTGSGASTTHTYTQAGTFSVTLAISDGKNSPVNAPGVSVTTRTLSGTWNGAISGAGFTASTVANLTQSGTSVSGTVRFPQIPSLGTGRVSGSVSSPLNVSFSVSFPGFVPFSFRGTSDEAVSRLSGTVTGSGFTGESWTMTRQ